MSDEFLKATFTADTSNFDKGAQQVEKASERVEATVESAAAGVQTSTTKMSASMQSAADSATKTADTVKGKFAGLFGSAELPSQKATAAIASVTKAVEQTGTSLATNQRQQASWGDALSASTAKVRDVIGGAFSAISKSAKATGDVVAGVGGVVGAAGNVIAQSFANSSKTADAARAAHERAAAGMVNAYTVAAAAVAAAVHRAISEASQLGNTAEVTGINTDALQRLKFAVEQTGGSFQGVVAAVKSYGETVNEIATNPTAKAAQALNLMGVSLRDSSGQVKDFNTLLLDVADKFQGFTNGAQKAAIAQALFKGSADQLIPLLNRGAQGIRDLGAEAERTGGVWGPEMVQKLADADRELKKFTTAITRLGAELAFMLPSFTKIIDGVTWLAKAIKENFASTLNPITDTEFAIRSVEAELARLRSGVVPDWNRMFGPDAETLIKNAETRLQGLQEQLAKLKAEAEASRQPLEFTITRTTNNQTNAPDLNSLKLMKDQLDDFIARLNGLPVLMGESFKLDAKPFEEAMQRVIAAEQAGAISAREATKLRLQLKKQEQDAILETASVAASTITTVFQGNKAASIGAAVINTAVAVTKALSGSVPPFNFIQAGLVAAAGAAQIAAISSASETGGGSVAPVSGGGDASASASATAATAAPQAAQESTLFVKGIDPRAIFNGDTVRAMANQLLEYQRNGGKVVLT